MKTNTPRKELAPLPTAPVFLERLEDRIAPASLSGDGKSVSFTDSDGDSVTVKFSLPLPDATAAANVFKFSGSSFAASGPQTLDTIDLTKFGLTADTAIKFKLEVKTKAAGGGNGTTDVHLINATGLEINQVKVSGNLGGINAGISGGKNKGVVDLEVGSLGVNGSSSTVYGGVNILKVLGNVEGNVLLGAVGTTVSAKKMEIGGKLLGGSAAGSGTLTLTHGAATLSIKAGVQGGAANGSGTLTVGSGDTVGFLELGNVTGGAGTNSGGVTVNGSVAVGAFGNLTGGAGPGSGFTKISGKLTKGSAGAVTGNASSSGVFTMGSFDSLKVESIAGGAGSSSGAVSVPGGGKSFTVEKNITGGSAQFSGAFVSGAVGLFQFGKIVGGSGDTFSGGALISAGDFNGDGKNDPVTIKGGNIEGGSGMGSGFIFAPETTAFTVNNIFGGSGQNSGSVVIQGPAKGFSILGDLQAQKGGTSAGSVNIHGAVQNLQIAGARGGTCTVDKSVGQFKNVFGAYTGTGGTYFSLNVNGSVGSATFGGPVTSAHIYAAGKYGDATPAIGQLTIKGNASGLQVEAGFKDEGSQVNPDASIGPVKILGSGTNCKIWAGVIDINQDGTPDKFIGNAATSKALIQSVTFKPKSTVSGVSISSTEVVAVNFGSGPVSLTAGPGNDNKTDGNSNKILELK